MNKKEEMIIKASNYEKIFQLTMSDIELKKQMTLLLSKYNTEKPQIIIAKAVQLGMKYQEEKIKYGINIVFNNLNK